MQPLLRRTLWLVLLHPMIVWGQMVDDEQYLHTSVFDDTPFRSEYAQFDDSHSFVNNAYRRIALGYLPIAYDYRGERYPELLVFGMDLADGINPNNVVGQAQRLRTAYNQDSLYISFPRLGRWGAAIAPEQIAVTDCQITTYGAVGSIAGGFNARFANPEAAVAYDVRLRGRLGPSLYGHGVDTYEGEFSLSLNVRGWSFWMHFAPSVRHVRTASIDEAFDLTDDMLYNPSCGVFEGGVRNVARRSELLPVVGVMRRKQRGNTTFGLQIVARAGEVSRSLLDSYSGLSAYPDHPRALPSGAASQSAHEQLTALWREQDPSVVGINWSKLQQINSANGQAAYSVNSRVERIVSANLSASASGAHRRLRWRFNARMRYDNSALFKRIDDLLGASYALNIDYYNSDLSARRIEPNNADNPDLKVGEGDRVDYNYRISRVVGGIDGAVQYSVGRFSLDASVTLGIKSLLRRGLWSKTSREDCYGRSRRYTFADCAAEVVARYNFGAQTSIATNLWVESAPPDYDNIFLSPENSAATIARLTTPIRYGVEIEGGGFWGNTSFLGELYVQGKSYDQEVYRYYDDVLGEFSNLALTDIKTLMAGTTLAVESAFTENISLSAAVDCHYDCYTSSPRATIYSDADGSELLQTATSHLKGFRTGQAPTFSALTSVEGAVAGHWRLMGGVCGFAGRYVAPNPQYRMEHLSGVCASGECYDELFEQRRLGGAVVVEGSVGYYVPLRQLAMFVRLTARGFVAGDRTFYAYEQMRLNRVYGAVGKTYVAAPVKRTYAYPFVAMLSISLSL